MSREAFESWQKIIGRHPSQEKDRIARDYLLSIDHRIYAAWQAARAAALEEAAGVADRNSTCANDTAVATRHNERRSSVMRHCARLCETAAAGNHKR